MPGMFGIIGRPEECLDKDALIETIDLVSLCNSEFLEIGCGFMACAWLKSNNLLSSRHFQDPYYTACFSGDLIDVKEIPWEEIIRNLESGRYEPFSDFRGTFCFAVFRKSDEHLWIISDRTSQHPLFYSIQNNALVFSTTLSTFCRLPEIPEFNVEWLYEYLFFNYPIGQTTFIENVKRVPPATVLEYDYKPSKNKLVQYAGFFKESPALLKGQQALDRACSVFSERVPKYYEAGVRTAVSLTGGFDSRTVLSMAPSEVLPDLIAYTYGGANCGDIRAASKVTSTLQFPHKTIVFDKKFMKELPDLIYNTVLLSGGLERVQRSTLLYVFRELTDKGQSFPLILTGVSGDHLFRDHINGMGNVPAMIPANMMKTFQTGNSYISSAFFEKGFMNQYRHFTEHINSVLERLANTYGALNNPEAYLSFIVYEITPKYFAGEASIAGNYSVYRTPFWDAEIMELAYQIEYGTIGFSESLEMKDRYLECVLQASIIGNNKSFYKIPIKGIPLSTFYRNSKARYQLDNILYRLFRAPRKIKTMIKPVHNALLENWSSWFKVDLHEEINALISENSLISSYLDGNFLKEIRETMNVQWLGKILTAEIILNLMKRRWSF